MIRGQFSKIRKLAQEQLDKMAGEVAKNKEIRELADAQFFEDKDIERPEYINAEPIKANYHLLSDLKLRDKAIWILGHSRAITYSEIGKLFNVSEITVTRICSLEPNR